ncbi:uncharacterized protein LOC126575065 [Anopheles aquasalis]|uniref:uncharacterized protein LOC126575065 n=1 Tax=Anopheles aquasalis TaxID=42839 RepID=UPI00215B48F2|nr:uncharacterized protein LOC126575065 [Anopheles aquasalis]
MRPSLRPSFLCGNATRVGQVSRQPPGTADQQATDATAIGSLAGTGQTDGNCTLHDGPVGFGASAGRKRFDSCNASHPYATIPRWPFLRRLRLLHGYTHGVIALFPKLPIYSNDNCYQLQALHHLGARAPSAADACHERLDHLLADILRCCGYVKVLQRVGRFSYDEDSSWHLAYRRATANLSPQRSVQSVERTTRTGSTMWSGLGHAHEIAAAASAAGVRVYYAGSPTRASNLPRPRQETDDAWQLRLFVAIQAQPDVVTQHPTDGERFLLLDDDRMLASTLVQIESAYERLCAQFAHRAIFLLAILILAQS